MPEADWWLCGSCQSLNHLSARTCYSCRRRKPKAPQRASEHLNYVPVVTWDGRVRFEQPPRPLDEQVQLPQAWRLPPPLRDPVLRHITDVAPPVPHGARITYRTVEPPPRPAPAPQILSAQPPSPVFAVPPMASHDPTLPVGLPPSPALPPRLAPARPVGAEPRPVVAVPVDPAGGPAWPMRPVVPIPVEPTAQPDPPGPGMQPSEVTWPHWRDLLDVRTPDATRLREALVSGASGRSWRDEKPWTPQPPSPVVVARSADDRPDATDLEWPAEDLKAGRDG
jgi:hypothetical protein